MCIRVCVCLCLMSLIIGHRPDSHHVLSWLVISSAALYKINNLNVCVSIHVCFVTLIKILPTCLPALMMICHTAYTFSFTHILFSISSLHAQTQGSTHEQRSTAVKRSPSKPTGGNLPYLGGQIPFYSTWCIASWALFCNRPLLLQGKEWATIRWIKSRLNKMTRGKKNRVWVPECLRCNYGTVQNKQVWLSIWEWLKVMRKSFFFFSCNHIKRFIGCSVNTHLGKLFFFKLKGFEWNMRFFFFRFAKTV